MLTEAYLIEKARRLVELQLGWGTGDTWTNQDFTELSEQIFSKTGVNLSPTTLKRVWGRVKYDSAPSTTTLDTLVNFVGYDNWRQFKQKEGNGQAAIPTVEETGRKPVATTLFFRISLFVLSLSALVYFVSYLPVGKGRINPDDFSFSSKTVVTEGVPNSVVFDFNATKSPHDSVIIQQSWDSRLQVKVPKDQRQHTSIYYYPNNYYAKLIVGDQIVKEHHLLIKSDGWLPVVGQQPLPAYFKKEEVIKDGRMSISEAQLKARNITVEPFISHTMFTNVRDFGELYTDDFVFETSLKNESQELSSAACKNTVIYLLCDGPVTWIPLCAKGCISDADLSLVGAYRSGKKEDLSAFGVDFTHDVKFRIVATKQKGEIFINDTLSYTINEPIGRYKIVGISIRFTGAGSVDYVKLFNNKTKFEDNF